MINTLLLSKAWHAATALPSTKATANQINSIIFSYLFANKTPQKPSRDILTLNFFQGGIGILDFNLQQKSLRLNRLRHVLDPDNSSNWIILPRLYLASEILRHNNEWMFLQNKPRIDYADPIIRSLHIDPPFYLRELLDFLREYKYRFLEMPIQSTHTIYQLQLKDKAARVQLPSQHHWNIVTKRIPPRSTLPWRKIWSTTYRSLYRGKYLDTYYKFLHNSLPSGDTMSSSNRSYPTHCKRCHRYETTYHIFAECPFAKEVWNLYFYVYAGILNRARVNYNDVLFSTCLPKDKHKRLFLLTFTTVIVHELWRARCAQFHPPHVPTNAVNSARIINARIKMIHFAYLKKDGKCAQKLCLPSPVCKVEDPVCLARS